MPEESNADTDLGPLTLRRLLHPHWTEFTEARKERVIAAVRAGNYLKTAARLAGIGPRTLTRWLTRGEAEESGPYRDFLDAVLQAEAEHEAEVVEHWQKFHVTDWRSCMNWLERRKSERFAKRTYHHVAVEQLDNAIAAELARVALGGKTTTAEAAATDSLPGSVDDFTVDERSGIPDEGGGDDSGPLAIEVDSL